LLRDVIGIRHDLSRALTTTLCDFEGVIHGDRLGGVRFDDRLIAHEQLVETIAFQPE